MKKGFTLAELLITVSIVGIIISAIIATFASGLKVYSAAIRDCDLDMADVLLSLDKVERDLKNVFVFKNLDFKGRPGAVTFPGMVKSTDGKGVRCDVPGTISYYFDSDSHSLMKEEKPYPLAVTKADTGKGRVTRLCGAAEAGFTYYTFDPSTSVYSWVDSWEKRKEEGEKTAPSGQNAKKEKDEAPAAPLGVSIKLIYKDASGAETKFNRTVFIPVIVSMCKTASQRNEEKAESNEPVRQ